MIAAVERCSGNNWVDDGRRVPKARDRSRRQATWKAKEDVDAEREILVRNWQPDVQLPAR